MTDMNATILELKIAELQFRLATIVRLATAMGNQPLDIQTEWVHGKHRVSYEEMVLTKEQSDMAADYLKRTTTYLMAITIRNALKRFHNDPKNYKDKNIVAAYQISRLIRNAFAHSPIRPIWHIDPDCRDKEFTIDQVISLNTRELDQKTFHWHHYGGPLALFQLSRFVRIQILGDTDTGKNRSITKPENIYYQQGNLILKEIDKIPDGAKKID